MLKVDVLDMNGNKKSELELNENVFGVEVNDVVVHAALVNYLANQRQGTQSTKTRAEVRGGGRKPWRQKGTGRAGGIALGPKPRSYKYAIPKKMRQLALKSVLTSKVQEGSLIVVDKIELNEIKTKEMVKVLNNLKVEKALVLLSEKNLNVQASARNIENVKTTLVNTINVYDLLKYNSLVATEEAIKKLEEVYA